MQVLKKYILMGGEPLIDRDIIEILDYSSDIGLNVLLETNAVLLDETIDEIKNIKNLSIRASIEGPEEIHNIIRRTNSNFNAFEVSIENLIKAKKEKIPIQITCSVNKINFNRLYDMVYYLNNIGLDNIRLRLSMPTSYAFFHWNILKLDLDDFKEIEKQIDRINSEIQGVRFNSETIKRINPSFEPKFFIDPEGNVKPYPFMNILLEI